MYNVYKGLHISSHPGGKQPGGYRSAGNRPSPASRQISYWHLLGRGSNSSSKQVCATCSGGAAVDDGAGRARLAAPRRARASSVAIRFGSTVGLAIPATVARAVP